MKARIAVGLALCASACVSSRYTPRPGPWLAQVQEDGLPRFYVEGKRYASIDEAMQSDPEARRMFARGQADVLWGGIIAGVGASVMGLGAADLATFGSSNESFFLGSTSPLPGLAIILGGVAAIVGGGFMASNGQAESLDAMNRFNDHMFERWQNDRAPSPPTGAPAP